MGDSGRFAQHDDGDEVRGFKRVISIRISVEIPLFGRGPECGSAGLRDDQVIAVMIIHFGVKLSVHLVECITTHHHKQSFASYQTTSRRDSSVFSIIGAADAGLSALDRRHASRDSSVEMAANRNAIHGRIANTFTERNVRPSARRASRPSRGKTRNGIRFRCIC